MTTGVYRPTNMMHTLAIYAWREDCGILAMHALFERLLALLGKTPDDVWVCEAGTWNGKDYRYRNFMKRDVIHRQEWANLSYSWRRQPDARLYEAGRLSVGLDIGRHFSILVDEALVDDAGLVVGAMVEEIVERLQPTYGIGFSVPCSWSPSSFIAGSGRGYTGTERGLRYDSAEAFSIRGLNAGRLFSRGLPVFDRQLLDIFETNFISADHLAQPIANTTLEGWIERRNMGTLRRVTPVTWRWDVPREIQPKVRKSAIAAGLIADPFWTDLGWVDR